MIFYKITFVVRTSRTPKFHLSSGQEEVDERSTTSVICLYIVQLSPPLYFSYTRCLPYTPPLLHVTCDPSVEEGLFYCKLSFFLFVSPLSPQSTVYSRWRSGRSHVLTFH